jgi:GxxExxY protein
MRTTGLLEGELTRSVIGAFYTVYTELGYGFLENVYVLALARELLKRGHTLRREVGMPVFYFGEQLCTYRCDMLVDDRLIVESKAGEALPPASIRQLRNYLKAARVEVGLLLHFGPEPKFYREILTPPQRRSSVVPP